MNWKNNWITLARETFSSNADPSYNTENGWRTTEVMEVPDGVIMMTTIVANAPSGSSVTSSINTMFIPRVKILGKTLVSM